MYDLVICGGGTGGVAAAMAAARRGRRVLMSEEADWVGGQLTAQAVPPDENPYIEWYGGTRSFRAFREGVRRVYREQFPLTPAAFRNPLLNPGHGFVSRLCHEPPIGHAVLCEMLAPFISSGAVTILRRHIPVAASMQSDTVRGMVFRSLLTGAEREVTGRYILDATELGDVLPLTGTEYVTGAESVNQTGEPHAVSGDPQPHNQQGITHCFALSHHPGEDWTIDRPAAYDFWQTYRAPFWPGPHLGWTDINPATGLPRTLSLFGPQDDPDLFTANGQYAWGTQGMWHYRRIRSHQLMQDGGSDISLVNWPQNDYWLKPIIDVPESDAALALKSARELSLSLLYWLQTEAPHPDGRTVGYPGLRLRPDQTGTEDGLAQSVYVRESRRIQAETTLCEQHVSSALRPSAEDFPDSVGIGCYRIDLHPTTGGDNYLDIGCHPFTIPLGALVPVRVDNLLPACKNLGVTHLTNGATRLHPVEWAIGEAAGHLAAFCLDRNCLPRAVRASPALLSDFQNQLEGDGVPIRWPVLRPV